MPKYTLQDYRELDHDAQAASPDHQSMATAFLTGILKRHHVAYAVTGLMNFYLRGGISRAVGPIEIALQVEDCFMPDVLNIFVAHKSIYRPSDKLQQRNFRSADGTSKLYVDIQDQLVRVDLKPRGDAANLLRTHPTDSVEKLTIATPPVTFVCSLLAINPLIAYTFKDHHIRSRGQRGGPEYDALMALCQWSPLGESWSEHVRRVAPSVPQAWRDSFLRKVVKRNPTEAGAVRWALDMASDDPGARQVLQIGYGPGAGERVEGGGAARRNRNSPRHGDRSRDGYWIYSAYLRCWYHKHQDGRYSLEGSFL